MVQFPENLSTALSDRLYDLIPFYDILSSLEVWCGGVRYLRDCHGRMDWPQRGVYFFFEAGEVRSGSGSGPRVVRVGTHAVSHSSKTTLWNRLAQHRGTVSGLGGNHRCSIFRSLIGDALAVRNPHLATPTWARGQSASKVVRDAEKKLEAEVSSYIGAMPFLWVPVDDAASRESKRAYIERNAIALLSAAALRRSARPDDPPSNTWLGFCCPQTDVPRSGLWNSRHTTDVHDPAFLDEFRRLCPPPKRMPVTRC